MTEDYLVFLINRKMLSTCRRGVFVTSNISRGCFGHVLLGKPAVHVIIARRHASKRVGEGVGKMLKRGVYTSVVLLGASAGAFMLV